MKVQKKNKYDLSNNRDYLCNFRVIQKDLLYIIGLSPRISNKTVISE